MRPPPLHLSSWPYVVVRIDCRLCPRRGSYRLARLAVRFGPDFEMDRLLAHLASDCPWWRARPRKYDPRCGARFVDLDRDALPDLPAGVETDILRQRPPARENVPQRRMASPPATWRAEMLSDHPGPELVVLCRRCGRRDEHLVDQLRATPGTCGPSRRGMLKADRPRAQAHDLRERCDTR